MRGLRPRRARRLEVASLRRRLAAVLIDGVVLLVPLLAAIIAGGWLYVTYARRRGRDDMAPFRPAHRWTVIIATMFLPLEIRARNWRSPGYRALGLRRVDARSGGPVSVRSRLITVAVTRAWTEATRLLLRPLDKRRTERLDALDAEARAARHVHASDPEAAQRAVTEAYKRHGVTPAGSCLPGLASVILLQVPALWSPLNQTLPERLAGTVVVEDDG